MRLFVALALPPEAASELDEVVAPLRPSWSELRWTGVDAWHLTLAFLGEVDEAVTSRLAHRMHNAARRHTPLSLSLAGAGAFPGAERARVLWTGIQGDVRGLGPMRLVEFVRDRATKEPAAPESTLAIVRQSVSSGVIVMRAGLYSNCIRLLPPLTIPEDMLREGLGAVAEAIESATSQPAAVSDRVRAI